MDPRTQAKVEILAPGQESIQRLLEFIKPEELPRSFGGTGEEFYVPRPNAEHFTIPRGSMAKRLIEVDAHCSLLLDSYLADGDLVLEVFSTEANAHHQYQQHHHIPPSHEIVHYSTTAHRPVGHESHALVRIPMHAAFADPHGPHRELHRFASGEHKKVFTVLWSNPARLVGRQLTYCFSVEPDAVPVSLVEPTVTAAVTPAPVSAPASLPAETDLRKSPSLLGADSEAVQPDSATVDGSSSTSSAANSPSASNSSEHAASVSEEHPAADSAPAAVSAEVARQEEDSSAADAVMVSVAEIDISASDQPQGVSSAEEQRLLD